MVESRSRATPALKIVVLGEARVGKTSLSTKFVYGQFDKQQSSSVDASYLEKVIQVGEKRVKLVIWDTAGQEKYHALAKNYYQGASGALLVYDVTDEDSFQRAQSWYKELRHEIGKEATIILAGNKCDIINQTVSKEDADNYARSKGIEHVQTSAANGQNVEYIFTTLAEKMMAVKATQDSQVKQPGAAAAGGRTNKRGQLRVEGVQGFDPSGNQPIQLSRKSEKQVKEKDQGGGCCGGKKKE